MKKQQLRGVPLETLDPTMDFFYGQKKQDDGTFKTVKFTPPISVSNIINKEVPTGAIDGANTIFGIANPLVAGSEYVYLNGQLQDLTDDYTIVGQNFTFVHAPETGSKLIITYTKP